MCTYYPIVLLFYLVRFTFHFVLLKRHLKAVFHSIPFPVGMLFICILSIHIFFICILFICILYIQMFFICILFICIFFICLLLICILFIQIFFICILFICILFICMVFRWGTHLYMSLFLSVHPSIRPSVCRAPYLRNRRSSDHNFWYTYAK